MSKTKELKDEKPTRYKQPPDQTCANCRAVVPGSDLGLIRRLLADISLFAVMSAPKHWGK